MSSEEVDTSAATRIAGLVALLAAALQAVYLLEDAPTRGLGSAGWLVAAVMITATAIGGYMLFDRAAPWGVSRLVLVAAMGTVEASVLCALTGGEPERQVILLWVALCAAISPPRRTAAFLVFAYLVGAWPLLGDQPDAREAAQLLGDALLGAVVAALVYLLLARVRRQRSDFRSDRVALVEMARRDELTGLGNRRALQEALGELERMAGQPGAAPAAVAIFDLERFKRINDTEGLRAGDRCLAVVGSVLAGGMPPRGQAFRWGGDEFVVVLPDHDRGQAQAVVERLRWAVGASHQDADGGPLGTRWGLGELRPGGALDDALVAADLELLNEKNGTPPVAGPVGSGGTRRRFVRTG